MDIEACPHCDSSRFCVNSTRGLRKEKMPRYRCYDCGESFASPIIRDRRGPGKPTHGLARKLDEMDPEELTNS